jgi:hypothetical protein
MTFGHFLLALCAVASTLSMSFSLMTLMACKRLSGELERHVRKMNESGNFTEQDLNTRLDQLQRMRFSPLNLRQR